MIAAIDREKMHEIFVDCLYREEETQFKDQSHSIERDVPEGAVVVDGILHRFCFHPGRLKGHSAEIRKMLELLPPQFFPEAGLGATFMDAAFDKDGKQWGEQKDVEMLFVMAVGLELARFHPRETWPMLPGKMPYVLIDLNDKPEGPRLGEGPEPEGPEPVKGEDDAKDWHN